MDLKNSMENITGTLMKRRVKILCMLVFSFVLALSLTGCAPKDDTADMPNLPQQEDTATPSEADNGGNENTVEIPQEEDTDTMVSVPVENLGRANPFVPAGVSIASVAHRLGHASMSTTQKTYLHIIQELENTDIDKIMRALTSLNN